MRAARVCAPGSSPSHLGPPKARIMSISWKPWASPGAPRARACCARHEVTAAGGSSIIEFAGDAPRRPKHAPTPHGTRARFAAIHQLISSFRVRASDPAGARITSISGTPAKEGRRQWCVFHKGFAFTASPSPGGPRPRPQKGPTALPDFMAAANAADQEEQSGTN